MAYSASAKVSWLMSSPEAGGNGLNYAKVWEFFRGSLGLGKKGISNIIGRKQDDQ
jgi:hypothetical protein